MRKWLLLIALLFSASEAPRAEEAAAVDDTASADAPDTAETKQGDGIESPRTMSGMSILGNEETPKALVIVPWKSSELGDDITLSDSLDDRARPVDREVFMRELSFYEIRAGSKPAGEQE